MIRGLKSVRPMMMMIKRSKPSPKIQIAPKSTSPKVDLIEADVGYLGTKYFHYMNFGLLAAFPIVLVAPKVIQTPIELALCLFFPAHAHISMNYVISDYVPRSIQRYARYGMLAASAVATFGLLRLTLEGPGIVATFKQLWSTTTTPKEKEQLKSTELKEVVKKSTEESK
mmetsp:Transcript_16647/g.24656  ORF Transcript_16647/g.24656 Transcript_16647/m.24656 type:complete len:170 (-) Transcript_16647:60-569(-)